MSKCESGRLLEFPLFVPGDLAVREVREDRWPGPGEKEKQGEERKQGEGEKREVGEREKEKWGKERMRERKCKRNREKKRD